MTSSDDEAVVVTRELLRGWGLPDPGNSKKARGRVVVVGGSRASPGAVLLAGESVLRVGAGRLGLLVPASIEGQLGVMVPEAAVFALPPGADDPIAPAIADELRAADAVLVGPGFDDAVETKATLLTVAATGVECMVLDAFALGVLADVPRGELPASLILNPNAEEAAILLGAELSDDLDSDLRGIAKKFDAIVNCYGRIVTPAGEVWRVSEGGPGLGTSGSGDVLAGAITGYAARGMEPARAAVRASWTHARAGDRLTARYGLGFLARELPCELAFAALEIEQQL